MSKIPVSRCVARGRGCEAGNPQIGALEASDQAAIPVHIRNECTRLLVGVAQIKRCVYCGAVFIDAFDPSSQRSGKVELGYRGDLPEERTKWLEHPRWVFGPK